MPVTAASKLHQDPPDDIPYAEVLPLKDDDAAVKASRSNGPNAYAVGYKNYHDLEAPSAPAEPVAEYLKEATVVENLGWVCALPNL